MREVEGGSDDERVRIRYGNGEAAAKNRKVKVLVGLRKLAHERIVDLQKEFDRGTGFGNSYESLVDDNCDGGLRYPRERLREYPLDAVEIESAEAEFILHRSR